MSALDTIAGVAVGAYLVAVAVNGNSAALIDQAKKDKAFLKWGVAVGIAAYAYSIPEAKGPVTLIIFAAFLGLFLNNGAKIVNSASQFWDAL